jgi:hypothetical protein
VYIGDLYFETTNLAFVFHYISGNFNRAFQRELSGLREFVNGNLVFIDYTLAQSAPISQINEYQPFTVPSVGYPSFQGYFLTFKFR